jgi:hypothetical protein
MTTTSSTTSSTPITLPSTIPPVIQPGHIAQFIETPLAGRSGTMPRGATEPSRHTSHNAATNSRAPGGPLSVRTNGPTSGSTVRSKRRNRQQWRSASIAVATDWNISAEGANRKRYPVRCRFCFLGTAEKTRQELRLSSRHGLGCERADNREILHCSVLPLS